MFETFENSIISKFVSDLSDSSNPIRKNQCGATISWKAYGQYSSVQILCGIPIKEIFSGSDFLHRFRKTEFCRRQLGCRIGNYQIELGATLPQGIMDVPVSPRFHLRGLSVT